MNRIEIYDTTLRDGTQGEDINFSVEDKLRIASYLDDLGIDFIEGGWPGSNPRDIDFFNRARSLRLKRARLAAFGATRRARLSCDEDPSIQALLRAETPVVTVFGKSWDLHVIDALRIGLEENLEIIKDTLDYLIRQRDVVIYDAEHFFDGFKANKEYALATLKAAAEAKPHCIVLCDTNGGSLPEEISRITQEVARQIAIPLGIHCHNDGELAVANSLAAVQAGAGHVQGTINGYGERCGNANLCSVIANLELKLGRTCIGSDGLARLRAASRFVAELANLAPDKRQAFVGESAFAHKGGVHVSAVERNPRTYEHIEPELVGNRRRVLVSDLSGRSNLLAKAQELGLDLSPETASQQVLTRIKEMENQGYQFEGAEASFELLVREMQGKRKRFFELLGFRVIDEHTGRSKPMSEATIMVKVDGQIEHSAAIGNGPVNALDNALRKALEKFYPSLADMELLDYKVRVITGELGGTASLVRVLVESGDGRNCWGTVGVSTNIIDASWIALVDAIEYKLMKDEVAEQSFDVLRLASDVERRASNI